MSETPDVIARLLPHVDTLIASSSLARRDWRRVIFTARGSSDNAALIAEAVLPLDRQGAVSVASPSVLAHGQIPESLDGWLVVAVSQSGSTPEVVAAAARSVSHGAYVVAVTNDASSPLAAAATLTIPLNAGHERVIAATKTVVGQTTTLLKIAEAIGAPDSPTHADWGGLPDHLSRALTVPLPAIGQPLTALVGRGLTIGVAKEGALKIMETSGRPVYGGSAYDFLHGPLAMLTSSTCAVGISARIDDRQDLGDLESAAKGRGSRLIRLPPRANHPWTAAIAHLISVQRLALDQALLFGGNPDDPRGLNKVTATR